MIEPAHWGLRRRVLNVLDGLRLARPAVRAYELALAARSSFRAGRAQGAGELPLPPASLRAQVGPRHADAGFFLRSGEQHACLVEEVLRESGSPIEEMDAILDWGCGCGRVIRHWSRLPRTRVFGSDINPKMIEWCKANLGFADVRVTGLEPPLPYPDSSFDLVYTFSVFTHLPKDLQHLWIRECLRVLKPQGYLLMSTMGEYYLSLGRLSDSERRAFLNGEVVVLYERSAGTSLCSAYHPPEYVRRKLAADFEPVAFRPAVDGGRHDIHLLRKPERVSAAADHA